MNKGIILLNEFYPDSDSVIDDIKKDIPKKMRALLNDNAEKLPLKPKKDAMIQVTIRYIDNN